jgi:hypothetical protein
MRLAELLDLIYSSFAKSEGKVVWGDKSLFVRNIPLLSRIFPNSSFIHIVRDGRDVFNSWRTYDETKNCASVTALDWKVKLSLIERAFDRMASGRSLTVRYEDLLERPGRTLKLVCDFLHVSFEPSMLDFYKSSGRYIGTHHSELIFSKIDPSNREKWRTSLTNREILAYETICRSELMKYGYAVDSCERSVLEFLALISEFASELPPRIFGIFGDAFERRKAFRSGTAAKLSSIGIKPKL